MREDDEDRTRGRSRSRSPHRPQRRARSSSFSDFSSKSPEPRHQPTTAHARECKVYVDRLTRNVHEGHLREIFGAYGSVLSVKHNRQRGWAHIVYDGGDAVDMAIRGMDGGQIDGSVIRVSVYRSNLHSNSHNLNHRYHEQNRHYHRGSTHDNYQRSSIRSRNRSRSP